MTNNHGTWYDNTWQAVALHVGGGALDNPVAKAAALEVQTMRIDTQILANGSEWIELERVSGVQFPGVALLLSVFISLTSPPPSDPSNQAAPAQRWPYGK